MNSYVTRYVMSRYSRVQVAFWLRCVTYCLFLIMIMLLIVFKFFFPHVGRSRSKQHRHVLSSKRIIQRYYDPSLFLLLVASSIYPIQHCNALQSILNCLIEIKSLSSSSLTTNLVVTDDDEEVTDNNQKQSSSSSSLGIDKTALYDILQETNLLSTIVSPFPKLYYPISKKGISSFRSLLRDDDNDNDDDDKNDNMHNIRKGRRLVQKLWTNCTDTNILNLSNSIKSLFILCNNDYNDLAHEIVLGINPLCNNIDEAEYVAFSSSTVDIKAKIDFINRHPLSNSDDILHSLIHRYCEGTTIGEGGYTGYENSKYWIAGGPKQLYNSNSNNNNTHHHQHPIYNKLAQFAIQHCPLCVSTGVVLIDDGTTDGDNHERAVTHTIIAGGGKHRTAVVNGVVVLNSTEHIPTSTTSSSTTNYIWDPFRFIDLFEIMTTETRHTILDEKVKVESVKINGEVVAGQSNVCEKESSHIDDIKLLLLVQSLDKESLRNELILLQQIEICLLIQYELEQTL